MPLEAYEYPKTELIVPLMALMEAQVVILYFFNYMIRYINITLKMLPEKVEHK